MFWQTLRKVGDDYMFVVPEKIVEHLGLQEGQAVAVEIRQVEAHAVPSLELQSAFAQSWKRNEKGYRYLENR